MLRQIKTLVEAWIATQDGLAHKTVLQGTNVMVTVKRASEKKIPFTLDEKWAIRNFILSLTKRLKRYAKKILDKGSEFLIEIPQA